MGLYLSNDATLQRAWSTCSAVAALQRLRRRNHLQAADLLGGRGHQVPQRDDPGGWRHVALYHANTNAIAAVVDIPDHIRRLQGAGNAWHCCGARRAPVDPHAGTGAEGQWTSEAAWGHPECERHHGEHGAEGVRVCVHWTQPGERAAEPDGSEQPCQGGVLQDDVDGGEVSQGIGSVYDHTHSLKMRSGRLVTNPLQ